MKRRMLVSTCALVCLLISSGAVIGEGSSWTTWEVADGGNGHEYAVVFERGLWEDQRALAEAEGGYLATIMSQEEQDFIMALVRAAEEADPGDFDANYYWMGFFQDPNVDEGPDNPWGKREGWQWVTGEPLNYDTSTSTWDGYTNWGWNEPNNGWGAGEDFGCIHRDNGVWNDGKACTGLRAVIEKEASPQDTTPPETSITPDREPDENGNYTAAVTVSISATDDMSGVAWTKYSLDAGVTWVLYSVPLVFDATGTYAIQAYSQDVAGNVETPPVGLEIVLDLNGRPLADAGEDQTLEATGNPGAEVELDGSGSDDPDGDPLTYTWTWTDENGEEQETTGVSPTILLPLGETAVTLVVNDGHLDSEPDTVFIRVKDSTPPALTLDSPSPAILSPPNGKLVPVTISGSVVEEVSGIAEAWLEVDDEYGELDGVHYITGALDEAGDFQVQIELVAWREGRDRDGREYVISLYAVDGQGNEAGPESVVILVPHHKPRKGGPGR